jgi:hypothetical protein
MLPVNPDINRVNNKEYKTHIKHENKISKLVRGANPYQKIMFMSIARYN